MDEQERKRIRENMRAALKDARNKRSSDRTEIAQAIDEEFFARRDPAYRENGDEASRLMRRASGRNMLETVRVENRYGEESKELAVVKDREEYKKRPSVRASKKQRSKGLGGPSV